MKITKSIIFLPSLSDSQFPMDSQDTFLPYKIMFIFQGHFDFYLLNIGSEKVNSHSLVAHSSKKYVTFDDGCESTFCVILKRVTRVLPFD